MPTHEVLNQPAPLENYDLFSTNRPLVESLEREGAGWAKERASRLGKTFGRPETLAWGAQANANPPVLQTHDRFGHRIDEVEFHPAWHELMKLAVDFGMHAAPFSDPKPGAHVARAAMVMTGAQVEAGHGCPISMTYSVIPALRAHAELSKEWEPRFASTAYDRRMIPATAKTGALCGMGMTEKQGGSDVRANTTVARPLTGDEYELTGHKWFCSAPMCDAFLVLAQAPKGLSCFLLPRFRPDGTRNAFHLQRLKDKLGNRSNASSEVEFAGAWARRVGEEGRGVPTILEMVNHTRLDCVVSSAGLMRAALVQAIHHAGGRKAFGKKLIEQPLMKNVLADLCLESEAATIGAMRLARAYDRAGESESEASFRRLATAVLKFWICKRTPSMVGEALECLGGNGYVEASGMPRLYREAPLNSIWEGSGNVICLDVLRALAKSPESRDALMEEIAPAAKTEPRLGAFVRKIEAEFTDLGTIESRARRVVERMALALQAALLVKHGAPAVADAFCAARLDGDAGFAFGTLSPKADFDAIVERHRVAAA